MITIFKPDETDFSHNGLGVLDKNIIDPVVSEDLNGIYQFTFRYPLFAPHGLEIEGQSVIRSPVPSEEDQLFRVYRPIKSMGYLEVNCYHIFYDLIDNFIEDTNIVWKNGQNALSQLLGATQYKHKFRVFSDIDTSASARIVRMNPIEALLDDGKENSFINRWGGEIKRNNFDIRINKAIGSNRGKEIRHRKDLIGYEADVDWTEVTTRIMPKGFDGLLLPEKYVDSPMINKYVYPKIKMIEYQDIKAAIGEYADDEDAVPLEEAYRLLRKAAKAEYTNNHVDVPHANYKVDFVTLDQTEEYKDLQDLQKVAIGDTITVIHEEDDIKIEAKVISYRYNPLAKKYLGIELGNFAESLTKTYSNVQSMSDKISEISEATTIIQATADGKNTIYRGDNEPGNPNINDLWYKPNGSETEMYQYVEESGQKFWKKIADTAELSSVKKEVSSVIAQADADRANAEQKFNQSVSDSKDYTEAKAAELTGKINTVKTEVTKTANDAVTKADKAIEDAGFAKTEASTAKGDAATALGKAETAITDSSKALTNANSALTKVGAVEVTTGNLTASYDELTKTVGLKADQTTVDGIKGTITNHSTAISANAKALGLKADSSLVNTIKGTVDTHTTQIKANADGLKLKAEASTVNSLSGTVSNHTNQIAANAKEISARLTQAQVNSLVEGKNYVNQTSLNATAKGLKADITQVSSAFSNLDISDRNLILNGSFENGLDHWFISGIEVISTEHAVYEGNKAVKILQKDSTVNNFPGVWQEVEVIEGEEYTLSFAYKSMGDSTNDQGFFARLNWIDPSGDNIGFRDLIIEKQSPYMFRINSITETAPIGAVRCVVRINYRRNGGGYIDAVKFQKGNKATSYSPAFEDYATLEKVTSIEANINGLQTKVSNKAEQSQVTQLAGLVSSKVESKDYNSKVTQLDEAINLRVQKGDVVGQINVEAGQTLIQNNKILLDGNTYIIGTTFANDIKTKSLDAVRADIADLRTRILTADVITSTMLKSDTAMINKLFATDANINVLTGKAAFINSVKAVDIVADRITGGTFNGANMNIVNLNANSITSGTINGANSSWNLNTGILETRLSGTTTKATLDGGRIISYSDRYGTAELNGGKIDFDDGTYRVGVNPLNLYFAKGNNIRNLFWTSEGLMTEAGSLTPRANSSFHIKGKGTGSFQYLQFISGDGINMRVQSEANDMTLMHAPNGAVKIAPYGGSDTQGIIQAANFQTRHVNGTSLILVGDRLETPRFDNRNIYLTPSGSGSVVASDRAESHFYNMVAADFVKKSERRLKKDISSVNGQQSLELINHLDVVSFRYKWEKSDDKLSVGLIYDDAPCELTNDNDKGIITNNVLFHAVKATQELSNTVDRHEMRLLSIDRLNEDVARIDTFINQHDLEIQQLKNKITELENKIQQLESAA
ncbi:phage tail spike protein [Pisciglobus halotolerans]|uniref:Phage minor structural protein, N-terminal region n=1 Tax=Pisciglobus halotolerans TaxID=745365 RepID=A0A1I3C3H8_9LACT|nr:phage tail spike protein [Pisciglobus halotolerans]SFH68551.1 phage minor structural protein, N-terminal region [Pisciglobus halotolerans]